MNDGTEAFARRQKMLKRRQELLVMEEGRLEGRGGITPDELNRSTGLVGEA